MNVENWFIGPNLEIERPKPGANLEPQEQFAHYFHPLACQGSARETSGGPLVAACAQQSNLKARDLALAPPLPQEVTLDLEPFSGLSYGSKSSEVGRVQKVLGKWNSALGIKQNGVYDRATRDALTLYKAIYGGEGGGQNIDKTTAKFLRQMEDGTFWKSPPVKSPQQEMLYHASRHLGKPYRMGGDGNYSTDCGLLTSQAIKSSGLPKVSRLADMQYMAARQGQSGLSFHRSEPEPGDLVFFRVPTRQSSIAYDGVTHVTMYVGDGLTLAASSGAGRVILQPLSQLNQYVAGYGRFEDKELASRE